MSQILADAGGRILFQFPKQFYYNPWKIVSEVPGSQEYAETMLVRGELFKSQELHIQEPPTLLQEHFSCFRYECK